MQLVTDVEEDFYQTPVNEQEEEEEAAALVAPTRKAVNRDVSPHIYNNEIRTNFVRNLSRQRIVQIPNFALRRRIS